MISRQARTTIRFLVAIAVAVASLTLGCSAGTIALPDAPEVRGTGRLVSLTLYAERDGNGRYSFAFDGQMGAPTIRVSPGDVLKIDYINHLPSVATESCAIEPCMNMTNLHFHGMTVSPNAPQDDVLDMMAMPGQTLHYSVQIPSDHVPGLFWYHPHPHGESYRQVLDGMSGAIVVEGIDRYVPAVRGLRERVLVLRERDIERDPEAAATRQRVEMRQSCGRQKDPAERVLTLNGVTRPEISLAPGERQFWRIVNASADLYADLQIDGQMFEIVALDGMPIAYRDPQHPTFFADHILVPPAGRIEAIVTGRPAGSHVALRSRCVDTGPAGDPNPAMVLADLVTAPQSDSESRSVPVAERAPVYNTVDLETLEKNSPQFVVTFTEDKNGFYINGQKYTPESAPMTRAPIGTYQHWRIVNDTTELHPFHIHQVHFLTYAEDGVRLPNPEWLETVNVPYGGYVDVIMDFTNPVIRGMSVFHCHLLNHEDKGMMAKVLFE